MKKPLKKQNQNAPSIGDLILAVSSFDRTNREAIAAVADLLGTSRVWLTGNGRKDLRGGRSGVNEP